MAIKVAVDFGGLDRGMGEAAEGARIALERMPLNRRYGLALVGPEELIRPLEKKYGGSTVTCYPCNQFTSSSDSLMAVRRAEQSSVAQSVRLVANGLAHGALLCGDTRAATLWASLPSDPEDDSKGGLGLIPGVIHPPLALTIPKFRGRHGILLDGGTSTDCSPEMLVQFAYLGRIFGQLALGIDNPLVGFHANGEEDAPAKGNKVSKEAFGALRGQNFPNFVGNVQSSDLVAAEIPDLKIRQLLGDPQFKAVDVDAADGFVGNAFFKGLEGGVKLALESLLRNGFGSLRTKLGLLLLKPALLAVKRELDPRQFGAMPLLGTNGLIMIGHGSSDAEAIANGIEATVRYSELDLTGRIRTEVQRLGWAH